MRVAVHTVVKGRPLRYSAHVRLCIKKSLELDLIVSDEAPSMKLRTANRIVQSSQAGICCCAVILVMRLRVLSVVIKYHNNDNTGGQYSTGLRLPANFPPTKDPHYKYGGCQVYLLDGCDVLILIFPQ